MTPSMHKPDDLQRSPLLQRLSELDRLEPSPELDRAVMERERKMTQPVRAPRVRHSLRWAAPAALTAALAVIVTSVAVRLGPSAARREIAARTGDYLRYLGRHPQERRLTLDTWAAGAYGLGYALAPGAVHRLAGARLTRGRHR